MRFFPAIAELRKQICEGVIGDVMYVSANIGARRLNVARLYDPKMGGGSVLDMGIYPINFATMIFGREKPESIHASGWLASTGACVARYMAPFCIQYLTQACFPAPISILYSVPFCGLFHVPI